MPHENGEPYVFEYMGYEEVERGPGHAMARMPVRPQFIAYNGYMQATLVIGLADLTCAAGTQENLPDGAQGFTTIEFKTNLLGTALDGQLRCEATLQHGGRTTQVWDATVRHEESGRTVALFRCTQLVLYPRG
ncbi:MAG: PaaI family thioesterase [Myxococcota bacterium]